jgi:hypothetical protein
MDSFGKASADFRTVCLEQFSLGSSGFAFTSAARGPENITCVYIRCSTRAASWSLRAFGRRCIGASCVVIACTGVDDRLLGGVVQRGGASVCASAGSPKDGGGRKIAPSGCRLDVENHHTSPERQAHRWSIETDVAARVNNEGSDRNQSGVPACGSGKLLLAPGGS